MILVSHRSTREDPYQLGRLWIDQRLEQVEMANAGQPPRTVASRSFHRHRDRVRAPPRDCLGVSLDLVVHSTVVEGPGVFRCRYWRAMSFDRNSQLQSADSRCLMCKGPTSTRQANAHGWSIGGGRSLLVDANSAKGCDVHPPMSRP